MNKIKLEIDDILHKAKFVAGDGLIVAHHDRVKLKLKDLYTLYSQLPLETQDFLTRKAKTQGFETYKQALQHIVSNINQVSPVEVAAAESPELTTSWMGVRSGIEVPHFGERATRSIGPELINRNLMWNDDYYQYPEWQEQLESTYDVFNLNLKKPEDKFKLFYTENGRRTPRGIVPHGGKFKTEMPFLNKRELKEKLEHREQLGIENEETWTLRDINTEYQPINTETRMKVNCLNIKHELKKDYTDSEIIDYITNFEFVDQLIDAHLSKSTEAPTVRLLKRDPVQFKAFYEKLNRVKDTPDPFTQFYIDEHKQKLRAQEIQQEYEEKAKLADANLEYEKASKLRDEGYSKAAEYLKFQEMRDQDMINYTTTMRKRMEITTDQESLLKAAKQSYYANEDTNLNADRFLSYKRKQGETNLIKSAILNKLSKGEKLSPKQQMYLDQWKAKLNSPQNEGNDDLMLPYHHSNFTLDDISKDDLYKLNSLQSVDFNGLDRFPLNDLVLELSQLIDPLQLKTVESNLQQELMREEWGIKTSTVPQSKAAQTLMGEIEEYSFRSAGSFTSQDLQAIDQYFQVDRNLTQMDREYKDADDLSLHQFLTQINNRDDRLELLEHWFERKETEIQNRDRLPTDFQKLSDGEKANIIQGRWNKGRQQLMKKIFNKESKDVTQDELHEFLESFYPKLVVFQNDYPAFLPHLVKEIYENPNLSSLDREKLEGITSLMKLRWKEDPRKPLYESPLYLDDSRQIKYEQNDDYYVSKMKEANRSFIDSVRSGFV